MWFTQYQLEDLDGTVYIIWRAEDGSYFQGSLSPSMDLENYIKLS